MIYFLYITFLHLLWIYNIKLLTIILLAFSIPFIGYGQIVENPLPTGCYSKTIFYVGMNAGLNYSKVNYDDASTEYLPSGQIAIEFQSYISSNIRFPSSMLLYGFRYESKNYNILNSNIKTIQLESSYLTIPIKYQLNTFALGWDSPLSILLGGFYSIKISENSSYDDIGILLGSNYGIIVGSQLEYILTGGVIINLEYNFQYGFASTQNTVANSGNVSHLINVGFKLPSTIF